MNVFNLSFGKDSMALLILAIEQGIRVDRVMYCDIRFAPCKRRTKDSPHTMSSHCSLEELAQRFDSGYVPKGVQSV